MVKEDRLRALAEAIAASVERRAGPRSGPRSKLVEAIAVLLYSRPMRSSEIAEVLGFNSRYIASYLSYWRVRGLFEYRDGYWMLTEAGREYARRVIERYTSGENPYEILARQIAARDGKTRYHQPGQYRQSLPFLATGTDGSDGEQQRRRACIDAVLGPLLAELEDDEKEVVDRLAEHYARWGKTYLYLDQLQRMLDADPRWLMTLLRELQSKNLIYIYHDRRMGIRIGFSKNIRSQLDKCLSTGSPA